MKKLIPNINKMVMGGEPPRKPIYVSNKNDPRLIAYSDSLDLYKSGKDFYKIILDDYGTVVDLDKNKTLKKLNDLNKYTNSTWRTEGINRNGKIIPFSKNMPIKFIGDSNNENSVLIPQYKKPVQPIEYRPKVTSTVVAKPKSKIIPKVNPTVINKKIQMETTKVDTTPVVQPTPKTPPTPLTKKQYYEVPDANGKVALLTPEQFSRMSSRNKNDLMSKSPIMNKPKYYYEMNSSGKRQLIPENKIREYMQTKNK